MKRIEISSEKGKSEVWIDGVKQGKILYINFDHSSGYNPTITLTYEME